ncbi:MAG TPA: enoyl-CoA hydratase/isomerase family protein [Acidobacteriota bacterium]|nr:enoyl-CoA hydratase/isomerase family protein [Acidobacteriota bacterium]
MPTVLKHHREHTVTLTLNRPEKLNCINWEMMEELDRAVAFAEEIAALRFLVIRGAGDRAFSTGGDLKEWSALDAEETVHWIRMGQEIFDRIESLPALSMAVVDGYAYGGGLELALACDLRVATPSASFSSPEIQHGWPPGWGGLSRLGRLVGETSAKRLIFLGESISAEEAFRLGLVNWVVEQEEIDGFLEEAGQKLSRVDRDVLAFSKSAITERAHSICQDSTALEADVLATLRARESLS